MRALLILVTLTATLCALVFVSLGAAWAVIPWLVGIAIWTVYCRSDTGSQPLSKPLAFPFLLFFCLILAAAAVRLYKLSDFPLGFNVDELFALNNTLILHEKPFDPFGHTPLISEGWVETPNLYLYFNLLILKLAGVRYGSMKLFSVVPGVIACAGVFLIARLMFEIRVAFFTALLFAFGHWPVRLSRYGWDASFMVMTFALAIWLLVLALQRGGTLYAYFAGIAAGVGLYSYLGARMCLLSLLVFLVIDRAIWKQALAFIIGTAATAFPLFCYYILKPAAFWVRAKELSVFGSADPVALILDNVWRHALMFHAIGGKFARDNFPGLPALDPLTGGLFIIGLVILIRHPRDIWTRLVACTLVLNFAAGIFSVSQEGAPYMYRTVAVVVPAFLVAGFGVQWLMRRRRLMASAVVLAAIGLNLYLYFGLEARNAAAMRVMGYELRQIGLEIARDDLPVYLVGADLLNPMEVRARLHEPYASANPAVLLPPVLRRLAVITFSDRYDMTKSRAENFRSPKDVYFLESFPATLSGRAKVIFKDRTPEIDRWISERHADVRELRNIYGERLRTVATLF